MTTRIDDLTDALIDGTLADAGAAELAALVAASSAARERHLALLDVEAALRGLRTDLDLGAATVARIEAERADRTVAAVMAGIAAPARRRRLATAAGALAALAASVLLVLALRPAPPRDGPPPANFARLTGEAGAVEVVGPDGLVALGPDRLVPPGSTIRTGDDSTVAVLFPDATRLELSPNTSVRLDADGGAAEPRRLTFVRGQLSAVVAGWPTVVAAGSTDVVATRGRFDLWSAGAGSVRVELREGDVRVVRGEPARPLALVPGGAAFVRDATSPVRVEEHRVESVPRNRLDFPGALALAFAADGAEVWAASGKQWVRWGVGRDGFGAAAAREVFQPPIFNDGPVATLTPDGRVLVASRVDDKEDRTLIRDLPGGALRRVFPVRVSEPRFLCVAPDGAWVATVSPRPDPRVRVWDAATGAERFSRGLDAPAFCAAATPDGRHVAVEQSDLGRGTNNKLLILDAATGEPAFDLPTRRRQVTALAFTPDGRTVAAGFNGAVHLWDVRGRALVRTVEGFERVVTRVAFSADGRLVAAGTQDGQVWVWAAATGRRVQVLQTGAHGVRALAFSPDGRFLATATNKGPVALWEVAAEPADPDA
ncbi:FecR domain-containing protein [Urbifossiella limnaea]|uniref:WD domain, G-beta repeat n=1 Tax=Urbifossiella limnaea TaxID=2528023 RepID=A0A517XQI2_9BACT|nr:FecR domain-containing protein [Urbifossiella limnaea]QDU19775.1 WD domain, G-beta repeat [Urbifossiella limnaea]